MDLIHSQGNQTTNHERSSRLTKETENWFLVQNGNFNIQVQPGLMIGPNQGKILKNSKIITAFRGNSLP